MIGPGPGAAYGSASRRLSALVGRLAKKFPGRLSALPLA